MMDSLLKRIENNKKAHTRWLAMILCLSMIVSLGTFAGFHKTAVAKTYTKEVLDCPYAQEGASPVAHVHNDDCYDGDTLVCTLPEREAHTHTEECFAEQRRLTCVLEENPGHQHGDACYAAREEITCGLEENPGHVHNGTCFNESGVLICGKEAGEGAHVHTADCFTTVYDLVCDIPEGEGAHTHTDECYTTERVQVCGQEELPVHVHGPECIRTVEWNEGEDEPVVTDEPAESTVPEMPVSDPDADLESVEDWNREFENFELSGNWARDLILVAATQQGRGESPNNFEAFLNDAGDAWVRYGYTRYGAWYGVPYAEEWSAMFVSFCLRYAGIPEENVPNNPTAAFMAESFQKGELFAGRDYVPAVGDLIFFDTVVDDDITNIDHMGIVYHVDAEDGTINTVEGDRTDAVATFGYHLDDEQIVGYGILPQNPNYNYEEEITDDETDGLIVMTEEEEKNEESADTDEATVPSVPMPAQSWERTAGGIKVTVDAPEGAFPENTTIAVTPVNGNRLKDTVSDAVSGEVLEVQAVDITFFDAEGHEIEPAIPIRVSMTPAATEHSEEKTSVVHVDIAQQTAELIEQAAGTEFDNSEVVFDADAFTIYAIVYTYQVEYEYEVDGKTFTSSMPGAENMTLTQIVEGLGIVGEEELETFVSKIASIASSNEEVAVVTENNEIRVLKDGEAKIVITMQDGAKFHIDVRAEGETSASNETATVSTVGELYLPADAELKTEVLDEVKSESAIAAVEAQEGTANSNTAAAETAYQVFDISLENVEADQYDGFQVEVKLPEGVVGRDFRLYHVHGGKVDELKLDNVDPDGEAVLLESVSFVTPSFSQFVLSYTVDFEYTDPVTGETFYWSWPGEGSYSVASIMTELGIFGEVTDVNLKRIDDMGGPANALYLSEDGSMLVSETSFLDTFVLTAIVDGVEYTVIVKDAVITGYTALEDVMNISVIMQEGNSIVGPTTTTILHGDLSFVVKNSEAFNNLRAVATSTGGDNKIKFDYDLTDLINAHDTLSRLSGYGDLNGGSGKLGTFRVENGHLLIELDANKVTNVDTAEGSLTLNISLDSTEAADGDTEQFEFPGGAGSFEINWPEKDHGAGTKSVDHVSDTIFPGQNENEYLEYNYILTLDGGTDLSTLNLTDYLPAGMELKGEIDVSCVTTTQTQTSTKGENGLWSAWNNYGTASSTQTVGSISSPVISDGKITADIWGSLGMSENPDKKTQPVLSSDENTRTREVTSSKYTLTYTACITRSKALELMGDGNKLDLKNTAVWNEGGTPIPGGETTVTINKGTLIPGTKVIEPGNPSNIEAKTEDIIKIDNVDYVVVAYAVSIQEPIDASAAVLTDRLSQYQTLYPGGGAAELCVNDQRVKYTELTANDGTITYDLQKELQSLNPAQSFTKNTKYTLRYKTLVKKEDFGKEITNETDWLIGSEPVDGEDKTVVITKKPPKDGEKRHTRTETHVTGNGPWEIPWEIKTRQDQTFKDVTLSDTFSTDQTLEKSSFVIKINNIEYTMQGYPQIADFISYPSNNSFKIEDFDGLLKYLTGDNSDPAFKANTDYRVLYSTYTSQYDDPATTDKEKSVNSSQWTFDGENDKPTNPDITLEKDEYNPGEKKVKSEEGTANGHWTTDGEAEVEAITIEEDDNKIDLSYKISLKEPMDDVTKAVLTDTFSSLESLNTESMVIHFKGRDYAVPAELLSVSGNTFTVDFVAVMRQYMGDFYTLEKGQEYELRYNTSIPLTDEVKALLKSKENISGQEVIKGLTVENHQTWHFDGPNGPEDKPGESVEYTFKEKPYNGGDKGVAVWSNDSNEWMTHTSGVTVDENGQPVYGDFEENSNAGITVTKVDGTDNRLHYTIKLTEHRNANKVVLKDQYYRNQTLDTNSFTVKFRQNGRMHTINVPAGSIITENHSFEMNLTDVLTEAGYTFMPEVEYTIEYDTTVSETGNDHGGSGNSHDPSEGDGFDNVATWEFDDGEGVEPGGETEVHLDVPDYLPGTKKVTVREELADKYKKTSDWYNWYHNGNQENIAHESDSFRISKVVEEPASLEDGGYHLDYVVTIYEERPIETAVLTDTFKGTAQQTLQSDSFKLQIGRDGTWFPIPAEFITTQDSTVGYTLDLTSFLASIGKGFDKYTYYDIMFSAVTTVNGNINGSGDGQDNRADWTLNNEVTVEGGHTEAHIEKVPHLDKTYYNKEDVEQGEVDFGEKVKYVITYGDPGQVLNNKELRDSMTNYHHIDRSEPITVYTNYNKTTGNGTVLAENLNTSVPSGWQVTVQNQDGNWNKNMWDSVLYIKFPSSPVITGPVTIVYTAVVGTEDQNKIVGTETVTNKVRSEDIEIHTDFELKSGTVKLEKTALPIENDELDSNNRKVWWSVDVTPMEMSLKDLRLRDTTRFSKNSAEDARVNNGTESMSVDTNTYELTWKTDSVDPAPNEEGGHRAGDRVPDNLYRFENSDIIFLGDITDPIQVKFATKGGNYSYGNIFLYNKVTITDQSWKEVGEPDDAEKELVEEGTVTAKKAFDEDKTVVDKDGTADIYWTITINTTGTATVYGYTIQENTYKYSTISAEDAKSSQNWHYLTFDTNTYNGVVITDADGNKLVKNVDYKLENNGLKFLKRLQGPITVTVPMPTKSFPSGTVWLYNQATLRQPDYTGTPIEGEGVIENYNLKVEKSITTDKNDLPKAPEFDQSITYKVLANPYGDVLPDGDLLFVDVLPAGMEYYDDDSFHVGFNNNSTQYGKNMNDEIWEDLKPVVTAETLSDGRVQQTLTIDFAAVAAKHPGTVFTLNGQNMQVTYKACLSESERNRLKNIGSGAPQIYENDVVITQGEKVRGEDESEWDYTWDNGLKKEDITDEHYGEENQHGANVYYRININPERREMNKGEDLVLTDRIETSMELMPDSVQVFLVEEDGTKVDVTDDDDIRISYDGITRNMTVRVPDGKYFTVEFFTVIDNAYKGLKDTFENTAVLTGESTWRSKVKEEHEVQNMTGSFSYTVPSGFIIKKFDGNKITKNLEGAEFTLYKADFPALANLKQVYNDYAEYDQYRYSREWDLSPFVLSGQALDPVVAYSNDQGIAIFEKLKVNELYYWIETKAPEGGYSAGEFAKPQYVILYTNNKESDAYSQQHAELLDHLISDANGIIVNNAAESYVWYATNTQFVQYKVEKIWQDNDNEENLRPDSIWVQLKQNGENYDDNATEVNEGLVEVKPDNMGDWSYSWYDLPASDEDGVDFVYTVEELTPGQLLEAGLINEEQKAALELKLTDYATIYKPVTGGMQIVNRKRDETTLLVKKVWEDDNNVSKLRPGFIEVNLYREVIGGTNVGTVTQMMLNDKGEVVEGVNTIKLYANDNWQLDLAGLVTEDNTNAYRYFLVEVPVDGYDAEYQDPYTATLEGGTAGGTAAGIADSDGIITITNKLNTARATKRWLNAQGEEVWTKNVTFKLMKMTADGEFEDVIKPRYFVENNLEWSQTITTTTDNRTAIWNHLDELEEGEYYFAIEYQIDDVAEEAIERNEQGAAMSFMLDGVYYDVTGGASSSGTGTIINSPRISKQFTKKWVNTTFDDTDAPSNRKNLKLQVQLIRINRADGQIDQVFNNDAKQYPEGQPVFITFDKSGGSITAGSQTIILPETADEDEIWTFEWKDLPITEWSNVNDESVEYVYKVREVKVLDAAGDDITDSFKQEQDETDEWTYTNTYEGQTLKISKEWYPEPEGDWTITAKLQVEKRLVEQNGTPVSPIAEWTGNYDDYVVNGEVQTVAIGKKDGGPIDGVTFDEQAGKYTRIVSLPKYMVDEQNKQVYELKFSAVEGEITGGYLSTVTVDPKSGDVTISNVKPVTDIEVEKVWAGDITTGNASMALYQVIGKKTEDLKPGEVDPALPSDKIRVTFNTNLSNPTNKNAKIVVSYTGTDDKGEAVSGILTLSNADGWSNSVQLPRGGTYSFNYTPDGTNVTEVTPDSTENVTTTTTINLDASAVALKTYTYTFTVPADKRPVKGSINVTCNGNIQTANVNNEWKVSFEVVEEDEVSYSGAGDGKFITGVTFTPETATTVSDDQTITMNPVVQPLTMTVPVSVTWDQTKRTLPDDAHVTVTIVGNGSEHAVELPNGGTWQNEITLDRLDNNGDLIPYTISATAYTATNNKLFLDEVPQTIDSSERIDIEGRVEGPDPVVVTVNRINNGSIVQTLEPKIFDPGTTIVITIKRNDNSGLDVTYQTSDGKSGSIAPTKPNDTYGLVKETLELTLPDTAGNYTVNIKHGWGNEAAELVSVEQKGSEGTNTVQSPASAPLRTLRSAPRMLSALSAPQREADATPSKLHTFYDSDVTSEGSLPFTAVRFKDLPKDATPVDVLPSGATGSATEGSTVTGGTAVIVDNGSVKWENLPAMDENGNPIYYYVVEKDAAAKADTMTVSYGYEYNADGTIKKVIITNTTTGTPEPETGALQLQKLVTINEFAPSDTENVSAVDKSKADGTYTFTVAGKPETDTAGKNYEVKITIENGTAKSATVNGKAVSLVDGKVILSEMTPGEYTVTEAESDSTVCSAVNCTDQTAVINLDTLSAVVNVEKGSAKTVTFTNNYSSGNNEDVAHVSVRKTFNGLNASQLPAGFAVRVKITLPGGEVKEYTLQSESQVSGVTFNKTTNENNVVWNWKIAIHGLTPEANVEVTEINYENPGFDVTTTINGVTADTADGKVSSATVVQSLSAEVNPSNKSNDFPVKDSDESSTIFIARLTSDKTALVISKKKLNLSERLALENKLKHMPNAEDWTHGNPVLYYSFEDAKDNKIVVKSRTVTYSDENGGMITFKDKCQWSMTAEGTITYVPGRPADFNFVNNYTDTGVDLTVIKVNKNDVEEKLPGAKFTLTLLDDEQTTAERIVAKSKADDSKPVRQEESAETKTDGTIIFTGLTAGYYEVTETKTPAGYVNTGESTFYIHVDGGAVTYLVRSSKEADKNQKLSEWEVVENGTELVTFNKENKTATVQNEPGAQLPQTGGIGTTLFTALGGLMTATAGAILTMKSYRRRKQNA